MLPPRKAGLPLVIGLLLGLPGIGPAATDPNTVDFAGAIRAEAERELQGYARRRGWVNYEYEIEVWVPGAAERQETCRAGVQVARAQDDGRLWGRVPYLISCADPSWRVRARADVALRLPVVAARRNISRGETLNHRTMTLQQMNLADIYGDFVTDRRLLAGKRARRAIRGGQVITLDQAIAPLLVERGDNVLIRVAVEGVEASMTGEALQSGSEGEGIRVRNHSSGKVITAWVIARGVVEARM